MMRTTRFGLVLLVALAACADETGGAGGQGGVPTGTLTSSSTQGDLRVDLSFDQGSFAADEPVDATVTITNTSKHQVKLLTWFLPTADLESSTFTVSHAGAHAQFLGPDYKRPNAQGSDFIHLASGASITAHVDLAKFYDFTAGGDYQVQLDLDDAALRPGNSTARLTTQPLSIWVEGRQLPEVEPVVIEATAGSIGFSGRCSASQQADIVTAVNNAGNISNGARDYLAGSPSATQRYTTWFGAFSTSGWDQVHTHFVSIADAFATKDIVVDCKCKKNYYAYVYPNQPYKIYVCRAFWSAPPTGTDSKAGTLVHEMSHFDVTAGTDDVVYGQTACRSLAQSDPAGARNNADSHEYFAENTPVLP